MGKFFVTGATGFVGRSLVEHLLVRGITAVAAGRHTPASYGLRREAQHTYFDLEKPHELRPESLEGVECVFHLAARVHVMRQTPEDIERFEVLNVRGTETLARTAARAGVRRFVFLSSIKVNGERTDSQPFTAEDEPRPADAYGLSKYNAEKALWHVAAETGLEVVVIRPPLVYGPDVRANFLRLLSLVHHGVPLPLRAVNNRRSLISIWNLVDALQLAATHSDAGGRTWLVSDDDDVSTPQLLSLIARAMKRPTRLWPVPLPILRVGAYSAGKSAELSRLVDSLQVDIASTRALLGYKPSLSLEDGIRLTTESYLRTHSAAR